MGYENQYATANHYPPQWRRRRTATRPSSAEAPQFSWIFTQQVVPQRLFTLSVAPAEYGHVSESIFNDLVSLWRRETVALSSLEKKAMHPAYQRIIALGPGVIPLILREMKRKPGHWFWALDALTQGLNPAHYCKNLTEATQAWISWGESQGYL